MPIIGIMASQISGHLWSPAGAYDALATVTVPSGGVASITFAGIPSGYKHLQIRGFVRSLSSNGTDGVGLYAQLNSDAGNNYAYHKLLGNGSSATASAGSSTNYSEFTVSSASGVTANVFGVFVLDILDYSNTNKNKTLRSLGGYDANGSGYTHFASVLWQNTAAVNSILIKDGIGTGFAANSSFALYGVK